VTGGRYLLKPEGSSAASTFQHDVDLLVRPARSHPITAGLGPILIQDETYRGTWISPQAEVLLATDHPSSDGPVAWIGPYRKSRVVCIQLGHGREAHQHPAYRRLVYQAIQWAAAKRP
ncbi:MAG: ThuA domain-containing protein, partial [Candidatus Solibacter usitatus]|nr:ThuA domain-containing protein [Candidatus Solibacter usitatus]